MNIIELFHHLSRLCHARQIAPENIRITVEFLTPEDDSKAECALRKEAQGIVCGYELIDTICRGRDFTVLGFRLNVKRFEYPPSRYPRLCICKHCRGH